MLRSTPNQDCCLRPDLTTEKDCQGATLESLHRMQAEGVGVGAIHYEKRCSGSGGNPCAE